MIKTRLIRLLGKSKKYIYLQVLWQWLSLLCQIFLVFGIVSILGIITGENTGTGGVTTAFVVLIAVSIILRVVCDRKAASASHEASVDVKRVLRIKIYEKVLRLGSSYREQVPTSEITQLSSEGVEQLETYFGKYLSQFFYSLIAPLTLFFVLMRVSLQASIVMLICVPLIPAVIVMVQKIAKRLLSKYWDIYADLGDSFLENLQGLTTLKIYKADQQAADEMDVESEHFRKITMKVLQMQLNSIIVMDVIAYGGAAAGMVIALSQAAAGSLGLSGTLMIILLSAEFFIPMRTLGSFFHIAMNGMAASDRMFALLDLPEPPQGTKTLDDSQISISFQNVSFSYDADRHVLYGINLEIPACSMVSLVGVSGSGKSTAAALLMGRNRGYKGHILVNGIELSEISQDSRMRAFTLVSSGSYIFKGTVEDNLRMAAQDASSEELWEALRKVRLDGYVMGQGGLCAPVTEGGSNLSGGQRQRLAIARALLHDSPVYIFDEATSNIDVESEEEIMDVIHDIAKTKTVFMISHRLANVTASNRIYMLEGGSISEEGTHSELMERNGAYSRLYSSQKSLEDYAGRRAV